MNEPVRQRAGTTKSSERGSVGIGEHMFKVAPLEASIFIRQIRDGREHHFELPPDEGRTLVVGSAHAVTFYVNDPQATPVQFHLEQHGESVWLIPAREIRDLRINGRRVLGPTPLKQYSILQFAGLALEVTFCDPEAPERSERGRSNEEERRRELPASYSLGFPDEAITTQLAMRALVAAIQPEVTQRMAPVKQVARSPVDIEPSFTLNGTQIIQIRNPAARGEQPEESPNVGRRWEPGAQRQTQERVLADKTLRLLRLPNTRISQPNDHSHKVPLQKGKAVWVTRPNPSSSSELAKPWLRSRSGRSSWLQQLGLLTKARPALVVSCASAGALLLLAFLLAMTRLAERFSAPAAARTTLPVTPLQLLHQPKRRERGNFGL